MTWKEKNFDVYLVIQNAPLVQNRKLIGAKARLITWSVWDRRKDARISMCVILVLNLCFDSINMKVNISHFIHTWKTKTCVKSMNIQSNSIGAFNYAFKIFSTEATPCQKANDVPSFFRIESIDWRSCNQTKSRHWAKSWRSIRVWNNVSRSRPSNDTDR